MSIAFHWCRSYIFHLLADSPNKRSFRGPDGVVRGLDSLSVVQICARELVSRGLPWSPGISRGLPWSPVVSRGLPWYATRRDAIERLVHIFVRNNHTFEQQNHMSKTNKENS